MSPCVRLYAAVALAFAATAAAVSNLQVPSTVTPDQNATFTWSSDSSDAGPWTLALFSSDANKTFAGGFAIANNVNPQSNQITVLFPQVISPGTYTASFLSATNTSDVIASSSSFNVGAPAASSAGSATSARSGTSSATATAPPASISASLSSVASSISNAASSAASSARSVASSALSSAASAQSQSSASSSASGSASSPSNSTGAARALTPMWTSGAGLALAMVLGGVAVGAVAL